jgi:capsular exopolysaccharide synthesis family protein
VSQVTTNDLTLRDLLRVFDRRRVIVIGVASTVFLLAVLACLVMTRRYEATGVFELQKSTSDSLDLEGMMGAAAGGGSDSLTLNTELQTEVGILNSDTLALQVIRELNLEQNKDFQPHISPIGALIGWMSPRGSPDQAGASLENSPNRRERLLRVFSKRLKVKVSAGTRLIQVSFSNRDPRVAAAVVNHLMQGLIDFNFQTKYNATNQVSGWLEDQLGDLRKQSEDLQAKVVGLQQGSGIFGVGGTDLSGKPVVYSPVLDRLQQSSGLLSQAELNRIVKASIYEVAKSGDPEMISQLAGTSLMGASSSSTTNSLTLIQALRAQESTLKAQIGQDASQFGAAYPKLIQERASLKSVEESLDQEVKRIAGRAKNDYDIATSTEQGAKQTYESDRKAAEALNNKTIEYMILQRESQESQDLYQDLLKRLKEAGILEGLHSSNITKVDMALPPARPNAPNIPILLAVGVGFGLLLGGAGALFVEAVDNKVRGIEEVESIGIPLLGILPFNEFPASKQLPSERPNIPFQGKHSEFSESIRRLRSNLLISRSGVPPKVLLITSGSPQEGKSTVSVNLAAALAHYAKRVLLLEADMRRPVLKSRLHLTSDRGLSTILANNAAEAQPEFLPDNPNWAILPAGPIPPYPSEMLASSTFRSLLAGWRETFDFIVIDSPPLLPVTDTQILVAEADATVLVARAGLTTRVGLRRSYSLLLQHVKDTAQPAIGVLLNGVAARSAAYYGYYGNYGYQNYYGQEGKNGREGNENDN